MFSQIGHVFLKTISHIYQVIYSPAAKLKWLEELEIYLKNSNMNALIKIDPNGLFLEDIKQLI
jgi:hypothetical protein